MGKFKKGQVGLLIIIVVGVLVALIMSVASGTLSDVVLSRQEKENGVAFHVAEQGVEQALNLIRMDADLGGMENYHGQVNFHNLNGDFLVSHLPSLDIYVNEGDVVKVNLSDYTEDWLTVSWGREDKVDENVACNGEGSGQSPAALEVIEVMTDGSVRRLYYNAANCDLSADNGFQVAGVGSNGFISRVNLTGLLQVSKLRLRPIYNGATINIVGSSLPSQIYVIHSTAESGDVQKEIEVKRSADQASSIFDFAVFSAGTIVK